MKTSCGKAKLRPGNNKKLALPNYATPADRNKAHWSLYLYCLFLLAPLYCPVTMLAIS